MGHVYCSNREDTPSVSCCLLRFGSADLGEESLQVCNLPVFAFGDNGSGLACCSKSVSNDIQILPATFSFFLFFPLHFSLKTIVNENFIDVLEIELPNGILQGLLNQYNAHEYLHISGIEKKI